MEPVPDDAPLVAIVGPTASGKSALALDIARRFNGEIIAADSRTVYQGMDIGTAKPSAAEQRAVPHHLLDVVTPDQTFTVADFQRLAKATIADIHARGKLPLLVGGSGLYVDAVLYNFSFGGGPELHRRAELQGLPVEELQQLLQQSDIPLPANERNPRHLIRALETNGAAGGRETLRASTLVIGLDPGKEVLAANITRRVDQMVAEGFIEEVRQLSERYRWAVPALQAPGYKAFRLYSAGAISLEDAKKLFVQYDLQYAKRQKTWFKRNADIHWIGKPAEAVALVTTLLNNWPGA